MHLVEVQRKGFIRYVTGPDGTTILWLRENANQTAPKRSKLIAAKPKVTLISPQGQRHTLQNGEIAAFCRKHSMSARGIYNLRSNKTSQHCGWRLA